jgi:hypothetical protein
MITDERLRELFLSVCSAEPLAGGWPELEKFARAVELETRRECVKICDSFGQYGEDCSMAIVNAY